MINSQTGIATLLLKTEQKTERQSNKQSDGHRNFMTESVQLAHSVKRNLHMGDAETLNRWE